MFAFDFGLGVQPHPMLAVTLDSRIAAVSFDGDGHSSRRTGIMRRQLLRLGRGSKPYPPWKLASPRGSWSRENAVPTSNWMRSVTPTRSARSRSQSSKPPIPVSSVPARSDSKRPPISPSTMPAGSVSGGSITACG